MSEIRFVCGCSLDRPCLAGARLFDRGDTVGLAEHLERAAEIVKSPPKPSTITRRRARQLVQQAEREPERAVDRAIVEAQPKRRQSGRRLTVTFEQAIRARRVR